MPTSTAPAHTAPARDESPALFQGVQRTAQVLRALAHHDPQSRRHGARLTDVVAATGLSKSTVHRLLNGLVRVGFVEYDEAGACFHLGFDLLALGAAAGNRFGILEMAQDSMNQLVKRTADTVILTVRSGEQSVCIDRREGEFPIRTLNVSIGDRRPLGIGAGGLALLAALPDEEVERVIETHSARLRDYPGYSPALLFEFVERTRRTGFAFNDGRVLPEMYALGMVVRDPVGRPVAALSVAAIVSRMQDERRANIVKWLGDAARQTEARIGTTGGLALHGIPRGLNSLK